MAGMSNPLRAWRDRVRRTPGGRHLLKLAVFALGAFFVLLGIALVVLPGPLTIPPILLGVYIWSTEFAWADRLRDRAVDSGREAWAAARKVSRRSRFASRIALRTRTSDSAGLELLKPSRWPAGCTSTKCAGVVEKSRIVGYFAAACTRAGSGR
mgnify:CR=1 FL=1